MTALLIVALTVVVGLAVGFHIAWWQERCSECVPLPWNWRICIGYNAYHNWLDDNPSKVR